MYIISAELFVQYSDVRNQCAWNDEAYETKSWHNSGCVHKTENSVNELFYTQGPLSISFVSWEKQRC